ncbi:MAG TPA: class I SAM-dependent methyltransferase [Candidatus Acidoferrum sp.]|nr:class I SAM-dependent methyltransferase [Candidatus Acidoferrum sp.]
MAFAPAVFNNPYSEHQIESRACPTCYVCGALGEPLYDGLKERLYGASGTWNLKRCPSSDCDLVWLDPMPNEEELHRAYTTYYTHAPIPDSLAYRFRQRVKRGYAGLAYGYRQGVSLLDRLLALPLVFLPSLREQAAANGLMYLRGEHTGRLLEIGCGSGAFLAGMQQLGWQVEGIDTDPQAIEIASRNYSLRVRKGSLWEHRYPTASFDAVVMCHVFEHLPDPRALLSECRRILAPGGTLVITTPNIQSLGHRKFQSSWIHLDPPRHLHIFSLDSLRSIVTDSGLVPKTLRSTARWAHGAWTLSSYIRRDGVTQMGRKGNWRMKLRSVLFRSMESFALHLDKAAGEELLLIAKKSEVDV